MKRNGIFIKIPREFEPIDEEFQQICESLGLNQSEVIRKAITRFVEYTKNNKFAPFEER